MSRRFGDIDLQADPSGDFDAVYLGGLRRNRVCWDERGRKMKVRTVSPASVTVVRPGAPRVINGRSFRTKERTTLAPSAVVYLKNPTKENLASRRRSR